MNKLKSMKKSVSDKSKQKLEDAKKDADDAASKKMDSFLEQMKLLEVPMKEAGFRLSEISLIMALTPAIACKIDIEDEDKTWNDDLVDNDKLSKTGKVIIWALKKADKAKQKFKNGVVKFASFELECTISPSLKLTFEPKKEEEEKDES